MTSAGIHCGSPRSVTAGRVFAPLMRMARDKAIDRHPGRMPEIRVVDESLIFKFATHSGESDDRLVIRCDDNGEIYVSIVADSDPRER